PGAFAPWRRPARAGMGADARARCLRAARAFGFKPGKNAPALLVGVLRVGGMGKLASSGKFKNFIFGGNPLQPLRKKRRGAFDRGGASSCHRLAIFCQWKRNLWPAGATG